MGFLDPLVSDRDPRFVSRFWQEIVAVAGDETQDVQRPPPSDRWSN